MKVSGLFMSIAAFVASVVMAFPAPAATTIYTDRAAFLAATTGHTTDPFPAQSSGGFTYSPGYRGTNFTITTSNGFLVDQGFDQYYNWNSGTVYDTEGGDFTFSVGDGVVGLGFDFGAPPNFSVAAFTINGVDYGGFLQPTFAFFGIVSDSPIVVSGSSNGGLGIIDNVVTATGLAGAVPEPSVWAMLISGFAFTGAMLRRRKLTMALASA